MYVHRITNKHGMYDVLMDTKMDIADCARVWIRKQDNLEYVIVKLHNDPKPYYLHHLIVGDLPDGFEVDHINGNPCDNTRCNLRIVTRQQNMYNRYTVSESGYAGVRLNAGKYDVKVHVRGKLCYVGRYAIDAEAAMVRDEVMGHLTKGYCKYNFEPEERCLTDVHMRQVAAFLNKHKIPMM